MALGILIIEKLFCGNSWVSFASGVLRWWLESLLQPSIWVFMVRSIFSWNFCYCLQEGDFTSTFLRGFLNSVVWHRLYLGVIIIIIVIYGLILLFFPCNLSISLDASNLILLTFVVQEGGCIGFLGQIDLHRILIQIFSNWLGRHRSSSSSHIQAYPGKIHGLVLLFLVSIHWHLYFTVKTLN